MQNGYVIGQKLQGDGDRPPPVSYRRCRGWTVTSNPGHAVLEWVSDVEDFPMFERFLLRTPPQEVCF